MEYIKLKLKDKSAQDMVEFTFVLPLLCFCFVFLLTGGQLFYNKFVAFEAVYNGARQASTERTMLEGKRTFEKIAKTYSAQSIAVSEDDISCDISIPSGTGGWIKNNKFNASVTFTVQTLFPLNYTNGLKASNIMDVTAKTVAYVEFDDHNGTYLNTK